MKSAPARTPAKRSTAPRTIRTGRFRNRRFAVESAAPPGDFSERGAFADCEDSTDSIDIDWLGGSDGRLEVVARLSSPDAAIRSLVVIGMVSCRSPLATAVGPVP